MTDNFDVTMGSFDFAPIADLVEINILDTLGRLLNLDNVGIYRDDGLISIPNSHKSQHLKYKRKSLEPLNTWDYR